MNESMFYAQFVSFVLHLVFHARFIQCHHFYHHSSWYPLSHVRPFELDKLSYIYDWKPWTTQTNNSSKSYKIPLRNMKILYFVRKKVKVIPTDNYNWYFNNFCLNFNLKYKKDANFHWKCCSLLTKNSEFCINFMNAYSDALSSWICDWKRMNQFKTFSWAKHCLCILHFAFVWWIQSTNSFKV